MIDRDRVKPLILLTLCMLGATFYFWISSRYPDLSAKAALGGNAPLNELGFAPLFEIKQDMQIWEKLFYGTINWLETNRRGMTFAFILGAFFLTIIPLLNFRQLKSSFGNAVMGLLMGTPLGLCVNCSSPVARAMQASGMRLEAALALLISSPTMNVVVLSMAFTFFPLYLVIGKIALTVLFVLVIIPIALKFWMQKESNTQIHQVFNQTDCVDAFGCTVPVFKGWGHAVIWSVTTYIKNFARILFITGPLMVLAGFIGTSIITFLPWDSVHILTGPEHSFTIVFGIMFVIALVGALLPSPMAFDIAMSAFLLQAGVPIMYVAVFLFTLGAYSVYAFFIVWQSISLRMAGFLYVVTVLLGLCLGFVTLVMEPYYRQEAQILSENTEDDFDPITKRTDIAMTWAALKSEISNNSFEVFLSQVKKPENIKIETRNFVKTDSQYKQTAFTRLYGDDLGLFQPYRISIVSGIGDLPRITTSVASGDVHHDGWEDILVLGDHEYDPNLILFSNINGKIFKRQVIPDAKDVILVALVDLNGDSWLDIVYTTYYGKNFVIYNDNGEFIEKNRAQLGSDLPGTTNSMGFGDFNKDSILEIFLGNWSAGPDVLNSSLSKNILLSHDGEKYDEKTLPGLSGETLTSLVWDFDGDGNLDVYSGNDFGAGSVSDLILLGDGKGGLNLPPVEFAKKFLGAQTTMSIDVGDIDNDLRPEYYIGQIAYIGQYMRKMSQISDRQISYDKWCQKQETPLSLISACEEETNFKMAMARVTSFISDGCRDLKNISHKKICEAHLANFSNNCIGSSFLYSKQIKTIEDDTRYMRQCLRYQDAFKESVQNPVSEDILQHHLEAANESFSNILLSDTNTPGVFKDISKQSNVGYGGWTWNAKFLDADNDGLQDIYIVNGITRAMSAGTKVFYHNKGDDTFDDKTESFGLTDFANISSYTAFDYDQDGDLDLFTVPFDGAIEVFKNNTNAQNNAIQIELLDKTGKNPYAIGASVIVRYPYNQDGKPKQQVQNILASGGYKSFDPPSAHFGLGVSEHVEQIEIIWPDGGKDVLEGVFDAGKRYRIIRS